MQLNEKLSVACYHCITYCFGQFIRKLQKFWQAAIQFLHHKCIDPSRYLALLPKLDSQSFCFTMEAMTVLALGSRGQIFPSFLPFLSLQHFHLLLTGDNPVPNYLLEQPSLPVGIPCEEVSLKSYLLSNALSKLSFHFSHPQLSSSVLRNDRQCCRVTGGERGEKRAVCLIILLQLDCCSVILKVQRFSK